MPYEVVGLVGPRNDILDGVQIPTGWGKFKENPVAQCNVWEMQPLSK